MLQRISSRSLALLLALVAVTMLLVGCESRQTGQLGNLEFAYQTDDDIYDFNKPIAQGARLDLIVREAGESNELAQVQNAESDKGEVLEVTGYDGSNIFLNGKSPGSATIEVEARISSGETVPDRVNMSVAEATVLEMSHRCTGESKAGYLVGDEVWILFELKTDNGLDAIGYGYRPITIDPAEGIELMTDNKDQTRFRMKMADSPQTVTVSSDIDDTKLEFELVEESSIDGLKLADRDAAKKVEVGQTRTFAILPTIGGTPICNARTEINSTTDSSNCTIEDSQGTSITSSGVAIQGEAAGSCDFSVTFPKADGGNGVSKDFSVDIEEASGE